MSMYILWLIYRREERVQQSSVYLEMLRSNKKAAVSLYSAYDWDTCRGCEVVADLKGVTYSDGLERDAVTVSPEVATGARVRITCSKMVMTPRLIPILCYRDTTSGTVTRLSTGKV